MTHTQIKAIASQIARRVQAGLARRPRVNIKTLAAALALTVVGAGSAHAAKCSFHYKVTNQRDERVVINARRTCKSDDGGCKILSVNVAYGVDPGVTSNGTSEIARKSGTKVWYYIQDRDGRWFKADRHASCQDTAASPVEVTVPKL